MNLLILGGYSDYNKEWVESIKKTFGDLFESTEIMYYDNWADYKEDADIRPEVEKLKKIAEGKENLIVLAKSVGVALTLQAVHNGYIKPDKCIFLGTAYEWSKQNGWDMDVLLKDFDIPALFFQQTDDTTASFKKIKEVLEALNVKNYDMVELPGEDHKYRDVQDIRRYAEPFIINS